MLGATRSNLHVSFAAVEGEPDPDVGYRRTEYIWLISVEPYKHHMPGLPSRLQVPVHYRAQYDKSTRTYNVTSGWHDRTATDMLGAIMIAEGAKCSPDDIYDLLARRSRHSHNSVNASEHWPDLWLRQALHVLQGQKMVECFDIDDFMVFAQSYAAQIMHFDAPPMVAYSKLSRAYERRIWTHGCQMECPIDRKMTARHRFHQENDVYGGLM